MVIVQLPEVYRRSSLQASLFALSEAIPFLRDCFVASLLAMTIRYRAPRKDIVQTLSNIGPLPFIPETVFLFWYIFFGYPFCDEWDFMRFMFCSVVIVTVTVIRVFIRLRERQIVLYLVNMLLPGRKGFYGLSGVVVMVLLTVFTFDIECTSTSYQYSMIV